MAATFSPSQRAVLDAVAVQRMTVVRAGPGSGKTRVFVEALRRELENWKSPRQGVAALSFTNVAHEVVSQRLRGTPPAPHFVGTLDSFLLRFVVIPFAKIIGVHPGGVRIVPDALARTIEHPKVSYGNEAWQAAPIFRFTFWGGDEAAPELVVRDKFGSPVALTATASKRVLAAKQADWTKHGRVTHSDCHFLASLVLKGRLGSEIVALLTRRFPVILVDEFQDTGFFLGRAVLEILKKVRRGLVVGDPDQAIYQFTGADRRLFDEAERDAGKPAILLNESYRCSRRVSAVATLLSRSQKEVVPRADASEGRCFLAVHDEKFPDAGSILQRCSPHLSSDERDDLATLARRAPGHDKPGADGPWTGGTSAARLCNAVARLRRGESRQALQLISREVTHLLLEQDMPTAEALQAAGIDPREWKRAVASLLIAMESVVDCETWNGWLNRTKLLMEQLATRFALDVRSLGLHLKRTNDGGNATRGGRSEPALSTDAAPLRTVHSVKGQEFAAVLLLVAKPHKKQAPCPSDAWWSDDVAAEEMEVAYVACSRAKSTLVIAVHRETYKALVARRPDFVRIFEILDQAPASINTTNPKNVKGRLPAVRARRRG
jgi:DNA helicase-2/ATP-dependent DNA helicase PcrA